MTTERNDAITRAPSADLSRDAKRSFRKALPVQIAHEIPPDIGFGASASPSAPFGAELPRGLNRRRS